MLRKSIRRRATLLAAACVLSWPLALAVAQDPNAAPATQPAAEPIAARVLEVAGDAQWSPIGAEDWRPIAVDDELSEMTQIRTGLRSSVKLQIGDEEPYTAMVIDSVGKVLLTEAYKTATEKRVRVGVGYGRIRAGVAEGGLRSDFTVDSPVATLSKRGTWNFGLEYERGTDRFEIFLLDQGLVEALDRIRDVRRTVLPGEAVTQAMRRWLDEAQIRRNVPIVDVLGQEDIEIAFNRLRNEGLGILDPSGGRADLLNLSNSFARREFAEQARRALDTQKFVLPTLRRLRDIDLPTGGGGGGGGGDVDVDIDAGPFRRPEGYFGSGRGDQLITVIISQSGAAKNLRPGSYKFRRAALEGWLKTNVK